MRSQNAHELYGTIQHKTINTIEHNRTPYDTIHY